jgi:hypothetical protein
LKISRVIAAFYTAHNSNGSVELHMRGFRSQTENLFAPLIVNPEIVLERIPIPELPTEKLIAPKTMRPRIATDDIFPR